MSIIQQGGRRIVRVADDGSGFDNDDPGAGQGLKNMRARAASIQGVFSLRSSPGRGTAIEVVLARRLASVEKPRVSGAFH